MSAPEPSAAHRRTVLRGAAWTAPVIMVGTAAPAFALSPCMAAPYPTSWVAASPASGSLTTGNGTNGYTTTYASGGTNVYLSVADNASAATTATTAANDATVTLTLTDPYYMVAGRTYTFSFKIASQHAGNNAATSQLQKLDIRMNGASIARYTTEADTTLASGYVALATPTTGVGTQTVTVNYTAPTTTTYTLSYLWTLPAKTSANTGNGDIAISAPTVTGC